MPELPKLSRSKASRFYGAGMSFLWFSCTALLLGTLLVLGKVLKLSPKTAPVHNSLAQARRIRSRNPEAG